MKTLVVSDIHNDYIALMKAYNYSRNNNMQLIFVGDIVDYGPDPQNTILFARYLADSGKARFVEGNHDNKIARYLKGNDVKIHQPSMGSTIEALKHDLVRNAFEALYAKMEPYINIQSTYITHGGFKEDFWVGNIDKSVRSGFLYGEVDPSGEPIEYKGQTYPNRVYDWTDSIPNNITVVVGHDRSPFERLPTFENNLTEVLVRTNSLGGTVVFTDTGGGKGGFVSGIVLDDLGKYQKSVAFN